MTTNSYPPDSAVMRDCYADVVGYLIMLLNIADEHGEIQRAAPLAGALSTLLAFDSDAMYDALLQSEAKMRNANGVSTDD